MIAGLAYDVFGNYGVSYYLAGTILVSFRFKGTSLLKTDFCATTQKIEITGKKMKDFLIKCSIEFTKQGFVQQTQKIGITGGKNRKKYNKGFSHKMLHCFYETVLSSRLKRSK